MPPHHVPWRDETGGVNTGYDIAGTYATNACLEEKADLPSLYFLVRPAAVLNRADGIVHQGVVGFCYSRSAIGLIYFLPSFFVIVICLPLTITLHIYQMANEIIIYRQ